MRKPKRSSANKSYEEENALIAADVQVRGKKKARINALVENASSGNFISTHEWQTYKYLSMTMGRTVDIQRKEDACFLFSPVHSF